MIIIVGVVESRVVVIEHLIRLLHLHFVLLLLLSQCERGRIGDKGRRGKKRISCSGHLLLYHEIIRVVAGRRVVADGVGHVHELNRRGNHLRG